MESSLIIDNIFKRSWKYFTSHVGLILGTALFVGLILIILAILGQYAMLIIVPSIMGVLLNSALIPSVSQIIGGGLAFLAVLLLQAFIGVGVSTIALKIVREEDVGFGDFFSNLGRMGWFLLNMFVLNLIAGAGILVPVGLIALASTVSGMLAFFLFLFAPILVIVFSIPAIYFALNFAFAPFLAVDGYNFSKSFKLSAKLTKGIKLTMISVFVVAYILTILGMAAFIIGSIITAPVAALAFYEMYQGAIDRSRG